MINMGANISQMTENHGLTGCLAGYDAIVHKTG
jgi:hypothetical protein